MGILHIGRRKAARAENPYPHFSRYTSADCSVFAEAGWNCMYDQMRFTAEISPEEDEFSLHEDDFIPGEVDEGELDESEAEYAEYAETDDDDDTVTERESFSRDETEYVEYTADSNDRANMSFSVRMEYTFEKGCVLRPALSFFQLRDDLFDMPLPLSEVLIKAGENRYSLAISGVSTVNNSEQAEDEGVYYIGRASLEALRDLVSCAEKGLPCAMRIGCHTFTVSTQNARMLSDFLSVCEKAGVFEQACFEEDEPSCATLTRFNK